MFSMCGYKHNHNQFQTHHRKHHKRKKKKHREAPFAERGWVQFIVLRVLHEKPMHGYQLVEELESRGYVEPGRFETGSIYIILKRLERSGLLSSVRVETESGKIRRVYSLTDKGEITLREGLEFVIKRKRVNDELAEYYLKNFTNQKLKRSSQKGEEDSENNKGDATSKL